MNVILFTHATSVVYVPMVYQFLVVRAWPAGLCLFSRSWLTSAKSGKWTSEAQFANRTVSPCTSCSFVVFYRINIGSFIFCLGDFVTYIHASLRIIQLYKPASSELNRMTSCHRNRRKVLTSWNTWTTNKVRQHTRWWSLIGFNF